MRVRHPFDVLNEILERTIEPRFVWSRDTPPYLRRHLHERNELTT